VGLDTSLTAASEYTQPYWQKALGWLRSQTGQDLAAGQLEAVKLALTSKVAVLTGGPGCGKSFTISSVVKLATAKNAGVVLVAPTAPAEPPNGWSS
jgi:exodeoxyribonuclease V alpha subunit